MDVIVPVTGDLAWDDAEAPPPEIRHDIRSPATLESNPTEPTQDDIVLSTIQNFSPFKGFGFIHADGGNVFFHKSVLIPSDYIPRIGDPVAYKAAPGKDGRPSATAVAAGSNAHLLQAPPREQAIRPAESQARSPAISTRALRDWCHLDLDDEGPNSPLQSLARLARHENWEADGRKFGILRNYLIYSLSSCLSRKKMLETRELAILNTGLFSVSLDPIHAVFRNNDHPGRQRWRFSSFTAGNSHEIAHLALPGPANLLEGIGRSIYDPSCDIRVSHRSLLSGAIRRGRISHEVLDQYASLREFSPPGGIYDAEALAQAIMEEDERTSSLQVRFSKAVDFAIKRLRADPRLALRCIRPTDLAVFSVAPLALTDPHEPDCGLLIIEDRFTPGYYVAPDILTIDMARKAARLSAPLDMTWLAR